MIARYSRRNFLRIYGKHLIIGYSVALRWTGTMKFGRPVARRHQIGTITKVTKKSVYMKRLPWRVVPIEWSFM